MAGPPILALLIASACFAGWVYGEVINYRPVRVFAAIACFVVFTGIAATAGGLHAAFSIGIPMSEAIHAYVAEASQQLKDGHTEFVVASLDAFEERVPVTYETGAFMRDIAAETEKLRGGSSRADEQRE